MKAVTLHKSESAAQLAGRGTFLEVLAVFLKLGLTSFGGPIAHLGYFRAEFVERRSWLTENNFVDLIALAQFLPGPASSQTGFAIGLMRAGCAGVSQPGLASPCRRRFCCCCSPSGRAASPICHGELAFCTG
jgi:chromate transporter